MNAIAALETIVNPLFELVVVSPLVAVGMRGRTSPDRLRLLGTSALVVLSTHVATVLPEMVGFEPAGLHWNWAGKGLCIFTIIALYAILPPEVRQKSGLMRVPSRDSFLPVVGYWAFCVVISLLGAFAPTYPLPFDMETLAYQLVMPSLAEEPIFRGILPALLAIAMGSPWRFAGAQLGWWWLAIAVCFGLGHSMGWSLQDGFQFDPVTLVAVTIFALIDGWIAARSGSVWAAIVGHSLNNSTYLALVLLT